MKKYFTKTNLIIALLLVFFVLLALVLYQRTGRFADRQEDLATQEVLSGVDELKQMRDEVEFVTRTDDEVSKQIAEIDELR